MLIDNGCKSRIAGADVGGGWVGCGASVGFGVGVGVGACVGVAVGDGASVGVGVTALVCPAAVDPHEASTMMNRTRQQTTTLFLLGIAL
jgi:hypothetical protein